MADGAPDQVLTEKNLHDIFESHGLGCDASRRSRLVHHSHSLTMHAAPLSLKRTEIPVGVVTALLGGPFFIPAEKKTGRSLVEDQRQPSSTFPFSDRRKAMIARFSSDVKFRGRISGSRYRFCRAPSE